MTEKPKILIVDDDKELRNLLAELLAPTFDPQVASSGAEALALTRASQPEAIITDVCMPDMSGIEFLETIRVSNPDIPIIVLSGFPDVDSLIRAVRGQAFDFFEKPVDIEILGQTLMRAVKTRRYRERLTALHESLNFAKADVQAHAVALQELYAESGSEAEPHPELPAAFANVLTQNSGFRACLVYAAAVAGTTLPVMIIGETGTGKDVVAKAVHDASGIKGAFVAANIAGLDDTLLADTLFGHVAGAFTSADKIRPGLIHAADGGTLFLDEIGDLSAASQVKLLRLLENGEYYPLGSDNVKRSRARIIAATHQDIPAMVVRGTFRSDLYFRLKSHLIQLPSLRERKDDLPLLLNHFLMIAAQQLNKVAPSYPKELLVLLNNYGFPGNLRELRGMVFDALSRHPGGVLSMKSFQEKMIEDAPPVANHGEPRLQLDGTAPLPTLKEAEELLVDEALKRAQGNQAIAARMLGLTRQALNKRLVRAQIKKVS